MTDAKPAVDLHRRVLPHFAEAEESVIGGVLFQGSAFARVSDVLQGSDFYDAKLEAIWEAFERIDREGRPIDLITVTDQMRRLGTMSKLSAFGSESYLAELLNKVAAIFLFHWILYGQAIRMRSTADFKSRGTKRSVRWLHSCGTCPRPTVSRR